MKMQTQWLLTGMFTLVLVGCGGGGGGSSDNGGGSAAAPSAPTRAMSDIVVASDNTLSSTYQLTIDVNLTQLSGKQAYIVICPNNGQKIDYDSCFTKASLDNGIGKFELLLPNHQLSLIAEVTPMEAGSNPLTFTWQYDNQAQSTWLIP
ncbi:hypothetical protein EGH82_04355 [Vibrio ponticus]|uniref:Lipoprotein n=1 Tax=Vibrio ponticus TaxID=265668 RepID=A0A3N3E4D8_9VIBR|nr:hypothetical protein [Vibrio ponticus]ROV61594.1 hypothetical protein EGH82_04355 [Vibrio ponticus]